MELIPLDGLLRLNKIRQKIMISIRQLLFGMFTIAFALSAAVATISKTWTFQFPTAIFALYFLGYIAFVGILAVYSEKQHRPFWIGCVIAVLVLFVGHSCSPVSYALSVYEEIAQTINRTTTDRMAAEELRENAYSASIIIRLGVIMILSLVGGSFATWASRRIQHNSVIE